MLACSTSLAACLAVMTRMAVSAIAAAFDGSGTNGTQAGMGGVTGHSDTVDADSSLGL
jgi:hypothetical protein